MTTLCAAPPVVTWHPATAPPKWVHRVWVCVSDKEGQLVDVGRWSPSHGRWEYDSGIGMSDVSAWAEIEYPDPPEESAL